MKNQILLFSMRGVFYHAQSVEWTVSDSFAQTLENIFGQITSTNICDLVMSILIMVVVFIVKELNDRYRAKLPVPIPIEVMVVSDSLNGNTQRFQSITYIWLVNASRCLESKSVSPKTRKLPSLFEKVKEEN